MPFFLMPDSPAYLPDNYLDYADEQGIIIVGGNFKQETLLYFYQKGLFPYPSPLSLEDSTEIIYWICPDPRCIVRYEGLKVSKSMRQVIRRNIYEIRYDTAFEQVITHCQQVKRKDQDGTWITDQLLSAYIELHKSGWAHSVEAWKDGELAGGLYGLSIGKVFFGESMFSLQPNASKVAFHSLVYQLDKRGFLCIDCQWHNSHLESLGAEMIPREAFLAILEENNKLKSLTGSWTHFTK